MMRPPRRLRWRRISIVAAPAFTVVGKSIPRVEGPDKVSGRAKYAADILPADALWAKYVRSPLPHARIASIDAARARSAPGVRAVFTAADFPNRRIGSPLQDLPILCDDRVRFVGDRVAVVAAESAEAAEEGAQLVDVVYEELPAVLDPLAAMEPGTTLIHPQARSYAGFPADVPENIPNVCAYQVWDRGDVARGFAEADLVVEHTFRTQLAHQGYLEPTAYVVALGRDENSGGSGGSAPQIGDAPGPDELVEVWASIKTPYNLRANLARVLDRPEARVVVHPIKVGADFGSKGGASSPILGYYLAQTLGRPIKFVSTSREDLIASSPRHPSVITLRTGLKRDGRIVAREARVVYNTGAYGAFKPAANGMLGGAGRVGGAYQIENLHIEGFCVYSNQVPCGYMRAPGSPQALFAVEAHTDLIARELGLDRIEFRLRNLPQDSSRQVLQAAAGAIGLSQRTSATHQSPATAPGPQPEALLIGRGVSICNRGTGTGEGTSDLTVNPDGTITVVSGMPDNGTGGLTVVAQVVAECLGQPPERIRVIQSGTDALPIDVGSGASRMTNVAGHAAIQASDLLKEQLNPLAARALAADAVEWVGVRTDDQGHTLPGGWRAADGRTISLEELAAEMIRPGDPVAHARATITTPRDPATEYCVQAAEVEVDPETGAVRLRRMASAQEVGTIINPIGHQGQIEGALMQGVGYALTEELVSEDGRITNGHLGEYKLPTVRDLPELTTINLPSSGPGPFEATAIGELPIIPTAGAIANAVAEAIGAPVLDLPITPERVLTALAARELA